MVWIDELIGLRTWGAEIGVGTHLTLELGDKWTSRQNKSRGDWSIWVAGVPWRIISAGSLIVGSGSDDLKTARNETLNKQILENILIEHPAYGAIFEFSGGVKLEVFIDTGDEYCDLMMMSKGQIYFINGSGKIGRELNKNINP
jgi:hypothetical protein